MRIGRMATLASLALAVALGSVALNPAVGLAEAANDAPGDVAINEEVSVSGAATMAYGERPSGATSASYVTTRATWQCDWWINPWNQFNANCSVSTGNLRLYAQCQDGSWIFSPWVGVGNWNLWVRCGSGLSQYGFQTFG